MRIPAADLTGMALFAKIVEHGSLSAAGRALGIPKASVSRELTLIEKRLGASLLHRSTRALVLTDIGRRYYDRIKPIVQDAEEAQLEVMSENATPSGLLRVTASIAYGQHVLAPRLFAFMARYPAIRVDLRLSDERMNVIAEGVDLAVRMGSLDDSELVAWRLGEVPRLIVAAPAYLKAHAAPQVPGDLSRHRIVLTQANLEHWTVGDDNIRVVWSFSTSNMLITRDAIEAGVGIGMLPDFLARDGLREGRLSRLLPDYEVPTVQVSALHARTAARSLALQALLDFLKEGKSARAT